MILLLSTKVVFFPVLTFCLCTSFHFRCHLDFAITFSEPTKLSLTSFLLTLTAHMAPTTLNYVHLFTCILFSTKLQSTEIQYLSHFCISMIWHIMLTPDKQSLNKCSAMSQFSIKKTTFRPHFTSLSPNLIVYA